ncbi:MAG TPA: PEP-CTERM sorting domain-containing protein [Pyrinomonadaceae bacterium]|nr:PEP-CTERM sorting domain-containing protein [Pyrinomonadaceae bacterium]
MKNLATMLKPLAMSVALLAIFTAAQTVALADEVTISGTTAGTITNVPQLTFQGNTFTGTTALGVGSLSDANRLGTFFLSTDDLQAVNGTFRLDITFTAPTGITGGQGATYTATITGSVSPNPGQGGVNISFAQPTQVFTFANETGTGSFTLTIPDVFVQSGMSARLTAGFTGTQTAVPEPATMILLGTGLAGVAGVARRRRKAA